MGKLRRLNRVVITHGGFLQGLARLQNGDLLVVFKEPTGKAIKMTRSGDKGLTWSEPVTVVEHPEGRLDRALGLAQLSNGTILQSYIKATYTPSLQTGEGYLMKSTDNGYSWSEPIKLGPDGMTSCDCRLIQYTYGNIREYWGRVLLPISVYLNGEHQVRNGYLISNDMGETWDDFVTVAQGLGDEWDAIRLPSDRLIAMIRDWRSPHGHGASPLYWTCSDDKGETWAQPTPAYIDRCLGQVMGHSPCLFVTKKGTLICGYRYVGGLGVGICATSFSYGYNDGTTWSGENHVWVGRGNSEGFVSGGYPSFEYVDEKRILCAYWMNWGGGNDIEGVFFEEE